MKKKILAIVTLLAIGNAQANILNESQNNKKELDTELNRLEENFNSVFKKPIPIQSQTKENAQKLKEIAESAHEIQKKLVALAKKVINAKISISKEAERKNLVESLKTSNKKAIHLINQTRDINFTMPRLRFKLNKKIIRMPR